LLDPSLQAVFPVGQTIEYIRCCGELTPKDLLNRMNSLIARCQFEDKQAIFEEQLLTLLGRSALTSEELIEGLCCAISLQSHIQLELAREVLQNPILSLNDINSIGDRFFNACAPHLAPGATAPKGHFARSFLQVALLAKSGQIR
jgi:hypothetical protein